MGSYGDVVDLIRVPYLDLHAFAEWREHLGEHDLLIPDGLIAALLDCGLALDRERQQGCTLSCGIVYLLYLLSEYHFCTLLEYTASFFIYFLPYYPRELEMHESESGLLPYCSFDKNVLL